MTAPSDIVVVGAGIVGCAVGASYAVLIAEELREVLAEMSAWLGLERIEVGQRGDLADALRAVIRSAPEDA